MPKKPDPTVSAAVDAVFADAQSALVSQVATLRGKKDALLAQQDSIAAEIASINRQIEDCQVKLQGVVTVASQKAGTLYP